MASSSHNIVKPTQIQATRNQGHGFRNNDEQVWYNRYYTRRTVVLERAVDIRGLKDFAFKENFEGRSGWIDFLHQNTGICNLSLAREFTASLINIDNLSYEYVGYVRGKSIPFNLTTLGNFIGVPPLDAYKVPYKSQDDIPLPSDVVQYLTRNQNPVWDGETAIESKSLKFFFYRLWIVISNTVAPTTHHSKVNWDEALLMYNIGKNEDICLVRYLISKMVVPSTDTSDKATIKMGVLITRFVLHQGVRTKGSDAIQKQQSVVNNSTMNRSMAQLQQLAGQEEVEEEEEGDVPPVQPPRRRRRVETGEGSSTQVESSTKASEDRLALLIQQLTLKVDAFASQTNEQLQTLQAKVEDIQSRVPPRE